MIVDVDVITSVVAAMIVVTESAGRYTGVVVVEAVVMKTGAKHEQACERTALGRPLKSNRYFKLVLTSYKKELEPVVLVELQWISCIP
jgi:hypothetical protein